jgi:chromate reductase, NAD(P)H dehydrogenase (quinone)
MTNRHPAATRRVLCLAGSLRRNSWNRRLLQVAAAAAPAQMSLHVYDDLYGVPLFDEDLEQREPAGPPGVRALRAAVAAADGLLIATPEYNQSLPGVLKNTLDWLSRASPDGEVLLDKPVAIIGASVGPWGTRLAQTAVRQVLHACGAVVMPAPTLFLANAAVRFDADGQLDATTTQSLQRLVLAFGQWMDRVTPMSDVLEPAVGSRLRR